MEKMTFPYSFIRHDHNGVPVFALEIFEYSLTLDGFEPYYAISYSIPAFRTVLFPKLNTIENTLLKRLMCEDHEYCKELIEEFANEVLKTPFLASIGIPTELIKGNRIDWMHLNWATKQHAEVHKWSFFADYLIKQHHPVLVVSENRMPYIFNVLQLITNYQEVYFEEYDVRSIVGILETNETDQLLDVLSDNSKITRMCSELGENDDDEIFAIRSKGNIIGFLIIEKKSFKKRTT